VLDVQGRLHGLQRIWPDGTKRFTSGTAKAGHFFMIGSPTDVSTICIAEGYATGATVHQATRHPVAVAFDSGNLQPVAEVLRAALPNALLVVCADDDHRTEGNPGLTLATSAAHAVGGLLATPAFPGTRGPGETDFNDLAQSAGFEAVRLQVAGAVEVPCSE